MGIEDDERKDMNLKLSRLVNVYFLSKELGDPQSMNIITDALLLLLNEQRRLKRQGNLVFEHLVKEVYVHFSAPGDPLQRLLVDFAVANSSFLEFSHNSESSRDPVRHFLLEVAQAFAEKRDAEGKKKPKADLESKDYHVAIKKA